jgi:hypothetical protein
MKYGPARKLFFPAQIFEAFVNAATNISNVETPFLIVGGAYFVLFFCFFCVCCFRARALRMLASGGKYMAEECGRHETDAGVSGEKR